ncbi:hypothetical protein DPMN_113722 [Dreissena polymorpha]|uniref:Uncharacterized protein n=1 Tax=Dreissena polymorpha TaxID=45954 RepID=A0A9D4KHX0_DREPO|nr:hypothetical protein DPMN_113722 [Dreissena polymorpha]
MQHQQATGISTGMSGPTSLIQFCYILSNSPAPLCEDMRSLLNLLKPSIMLSLLAREQA